MNRRIKPEAFYKTTDLDGIDIIPFETTVVGTAFRFDKSKREILVDLGYSWIGIIPEEEVTIYSFTYPVDISTPHQVSAIIGTQICAVVTEVIDGNILKLSRKLSMRQAWNSLEENSDIMACVTRNVGYGIFLDVGNGLVTYVHRKDCAAIMITDTNFWFKDEECVKVRIIDKGECESSQIISSHKLAYPTIYDTDDIVGEGDVIAIRVGMKVEVPNGDGYYCQFTPGVPGILNTERELKEGEMVRGAVKKITEKGLKIKHIG